MQNFVFALLLISVNVSAFLLFDSTFKISIKIDKRRVMIFIVPIVVLIVILLVLNPDEYRMSFYMSAALVTLMVLRAIIDKLIKNQPGDDNNRIVRRFFNTIVFPFFVVFISFAQCLYLFVWD